MKHSLFLLALAGLAVTAALPAYALNTDSITEINRGLWNLAEAYPCSPTSYAGVSPGVTDQQTFTGKCPANTDVITGQTGAAPGILCLKKTSSEFLDVNCFATTPSGEFGCVVQSYRFFKLVPGSFKCPDVYGLPHFDGSGNVLFYSYIQFGTGIRTWWSLNFTQPGTRFLLQVVSACQFIPSTPKLDENGNPVKDSNGNVIRVPIPGAGQQTHIHMDSWRWRVTASAETLGYVINLMHNGAISTLEIPCILGEDMFDALIKAQRQLVSDVHGVQTTRLTDVGNDIFNLEALIVANCLFVEVLNPLVAYPGLPQFGAPNIQVPGNLAQTISFGSQGTAIAGIVDTIEHPCCCKLLVDLEWIALSQGLVGQQPTLPTF